MKQIMQNEFNPKTAQTTQSRSERRAGTPKEPRTDIVEKAHSNNRKMNKARKNNRLYLKLAAFEMWRTDKLIKARR